MVLRELMDQRVDAIGRLAAERAALQRELRMLLWADDRLDALERVAKTADKLNHCARALASPLIIGPAGEKPARIVKRMQDAADAYIAATAAYEKAKAALDALVALEEAR